MDAANPQGFLAGKLEEALARNIPSKIHYCSTSVKAPPGGSYLPVSRLDMILSGEKNVTLPLAGGQACLRLKPGEAYLAPPGAWELHHWDTASEMLCIVPQKRFLRISHYTQEDGRSKPVNTFLHTARLCPAAIMSAVSLLDLPEVRDGLPEIGLSLSRALLAMSREECSRPIKPSSGSAGLLFERIQAWLDDNFQLDLSIESVAEEFNISPDYVSKLFRRRSGRGMHFYLTSVRMELARYLLESTDLSVSDIVRQCGFNNAAHFTKRFREFNGVPPISYRLARRVDRNSSANS